MKRTLVYIIVVSIATCLPRVNAQSFRHRMDEIARMDDAQQAISSLMSLVQEAQRKRTVDTVALINLEIASRYFDYSISFDSAIYYCDQALASVHENTTAFNIPYLEAWYKKGFYYRKWDKYEKSRKALQVVLDEPENPVSFKATWQMGKLYKDRGEFSLAFKYYDEALKLAGNDAKKKIRMYEYISFAYSIMGTDEGSLNAISWYDKLEEAVKKLPDHSYDDYLPLAAFNKGDCYYQLGDLKNAEKHVLEAERLLKECCDDPDFMGLIIDFKGYLDFENGEYGSAISKFRQGIELFEYSYDLGRGQGLAGSYYAIAEAYREWGKLDSAIYYADKTIIDRTYGYDNNLETKHFPGIEEMLENGEKSYLMDDLVLKGSIFEKYYKSEGLTLDSAIHYYMLAEQVLDAMSYDHVEEQTKIFWREHAKDIYYHLIRLHVIKGENEAAFLYSEKSKYVILEEHLRKIDFSKLESTNQIVNEYQRLLDTIKTVEILLENQRLNNFNNGDARNDILRLRKSEDELVSTMKAEYPSIYHRIFSWKPPVLVDIQDHLRRSNSMLIEYFIHDSMSYSFYLIEGKIKVKTLGPKRAIVGSMLEFLEFFNVAESGNNSSDQYQKIGHGLFHLLLDSTLVQSADDIIIVPDDILSILPFEVLVRRLSERDPDFNSLEYLIRSHAVRYLINAKKLVDAPSREQDQKKTVISFVPAFVGEEESGLVVREITKYKKGNLMPLVGAIEEMKKLCSLFPCKAYDTGVGEALFYEHIEEEKSILHLATHAVMNDSMPGHSKLIMQQMSGEHDDFIHVFELKNKKIPSDLVVLSACKTGVGKLFRGEGMASLGVAFIYAGSPNLVTSLWAVPDRTSATIMKDFYQQLKNGVPKFEALRQAKLNYLIRFPSDIKHPFYWGGFLYYGDELPLPPNALPDAMSAPVKWGLGILLLLALFLLWKFVFPLKKK